VLLRGAVGREPAQVVAKGKVVERGHTLKFRRWG
jgi:hypothetical protein